jgi:hypothetical protein
VFDLCHAAALAQPQVLEYVPDTVYRINKHYTKNEQRMPLILVKLYVYQMLRALAHIHSIGVCHRQAGRGPVMGAAGRSGPHKQPVKVGPVAKECRSSCPIFRERFWEVAAIGLSDLRCAHPACQ